MSRRLPARPFAVTFVLWGLSTGLHEILAPGAGDSLVAAVSLASVILGLGVWLLPWERWPRSASFKVVPIAFVLISLHAYVRAGAAPASPLVFVLPFLWLGLAHPRGTSLRWSPLMAGAYVVPALLRGQELPTLALSFVGTAALCVAVGETLSWTFEQVRGDHRRALGIQEMLRQRAGRFRTLVENSTDVVTIVGTDGVILYQSASVARVFSYTAAELLRRRLDDWVHPEDAPRLSVFLKDLLKRPGTSATIECRLHHGDGSWRPCTTTGVNLLHNRSVAGVVLQTRDVSERLNLEEELRRQAFHDSLTGLANRALFADRVQQALLQGQRLGAPVAVLFLDLDGFKTLNDSLGHSAGDQLLMAVAQRLQSSLRTSDTAARLGGDEFAVLVEDVIIPTDATRVAERILDALRTPFMVQGKEVIVRASIGIAISNGGLEADDLLRNADVSMYVAKSNGKGNYVVFQPAMHAEVLARLELETDLHRAFSRDEFTIYYQPTVDLRTGRIAGMEALLRWNHPQRGLVYPEEFIGAAEETGLILTLGRWVLRQSCHQARAWQLQHPMQPPLMLSVNLSASQLQHPDFGSDVAQALEESGLDPESLILEITESVLMNDAEVTMRAIRRLKDLGVRLAIDDFGTGYSSLGYIRRFEIDVLKVDKSFLKSIGTDPTLAQAVVQLGRSLGLQTIAEGIETAEQLGLLQALDCDLGQGYLFAGPLDLDSMDALLSQATMDREGVIYLPKRNPGLLWDDLYTIGEKVAS